MRLLEGTGIVMVNFGTPILIPDTDDGDRGILLLSQLPMK